MSSLTSKDYPTSLITNTGGLRKMMAVPCVCCLSSVANLCVCVCCLLNVVTSGGLVFLFEKRYANSIRQTRRPHLSLLFCSPSFIPKLLSLRSLSLRPVSRAFFLTLPPSLALFLSPLPLSSHLDLIDRVNSPSAIKDPLDSVHVLVCVCVCLAKCGRPKFKHLPNRFHQTTRASTNRQPQECRGFVRENLLGTLSVFNSPFCFHSV